MKIINYLINAITARGRRRSLNKELEQLRKKLQIKKILNCNLILSCTEEDCPFVSLMNAYDKKIN